MLCKECGNDFDPRHPYHRIGFVNVCGDCTIDDAPKHIGLFNVESETDYNVAIVRNPTKELRKKIIADQLGEDERYTNIPETE